MEDAEEIRRAARTVAALGREAASSARQVRSAHGVQWESLAADSFRDRLVQEAARLDAHARDLADLSSLMLRWAQEVQERSALTAALLGGPA